MLKIKTLYKRYIDSLIISLPMTVLTVMGAGLYITFYIKYPNTFDLFLGMLSFGLY